MVALRSRWVLGVSVLACGAALLVALLVGTSSRADDPGAPVTPSPAFAAPATAGEVAAMRTESSRTFRKADGSYQAQVSAGPVNYRDASGDWKPIDTDFVSDGDGGLETTEAAAKVSLPESLDDPAKVTAGSRWVSFEMAGADGDAVPTADGSTATYKEVLDGVDADYDAQPTGVKETLTLADTSAPASYRYVLDASSGLTPRLLDNGTVVFRDAAGLTRFWLPAPTVQEAGADSPTTDHVAYRLSEDRETLTVAVDPDWLAQAAFPVQVDPSIWYGDDTSCTLASATPTIAACGGTTLKLGHDAADKYRTALRFPDMALAVPRTASVMGATIGLFFESQTSATASTPVTVSGLSKLLGPGATWNKYDTNAAHTWTTAGGDIVADPQAAITTLYPSFTTGWVTFNVSRLAERWLRSPSTNNGVLLRAQTETGTNNVLSFDGHTWDHGGPNIRIDYEWHPGFESDQTFEQVAFDGTSKIAVNAATGNVAVDSTDVSLPGVGGLDLKIRRTFNGQNLGSGGGMFGSAWSDGINNAAFLNDRVWYDDSRTIYANGNAIYRFDRDPVHDTATTHAYLSPPNINADLVSNISTGVATLTFRDTGIKWTYRASFDGNYVTLAQISDPAGHHIDITPKSGQPEKIGSITDTNGAVLTFVYGTNGQLTKITKGATEWKYTTTIVNGHNLLTGYTNPTNQTTSYHYDAGALPGTWDKLDRVTDTAGQIFKLTYGPQGDWSQVTQVTQDFPDSRPDNITKFDYKAVSTLGHACTTPVANSPYPDNVVFDRTVETDNAGRITTYCYNTSGQVIQSWRPWDTAAPTITGVPNPFVFQDGYTNGVTPFVVGLSASDTLSGVKRIALEEVAHSELTSATSPCPPATTMPNLCPASFSSPVTINPAPLAEGAHTVRQIATDLAGNVATSATWNIKVDRTPPGAPTAPELSDYDDQTQLATILFSGGIDPALVGGQPGSDVARSEIRHRIGAGAWSAWMATVDDRAAVAGASPGSVIAVELRTVDAVGNISAVTAGSITAAVTDADWADFPVGLASGANAAIAVVLHMPSGAAIPAAGLPVTVTDPGGQHATVLTDGTGTAYFHGLATGDHLANASQADGTEEVSDQHLWVNPGVRTEHRIDLRLTGVTYPVPGLAAAASTDDFPDGVQEIADCLENFPVAICYQWLGDALRATSVANTLFGVSGGVPDSTRANAFKHSYSVAMFTRTMLTKFSGAGPAHWGYDYARLHELSDRASSDIEIRRASFMDTNNNLVAYNFVRDHPLRNTAQLCSTLRTASRNARYVNFPAGADDVSVPPNDARTRLIFIRPYSSGLDGSGNPVDAGFFPESKPCKYALQRYAEL